MKRIFVLLILTALMFLLGINGFAAEYKVSEDSGEDVYNYEKYLPEYVKEILKNNGEENFEAVSVNGLLELITHYIKNGADKYTEHLVGLMAFVILLSVLKRYNDNGTKILIINALSIALTGGLLLKIFLSIYTRSTELIASCSELMSSLLPAFSTVIIMGGGAASAATSATSLGIIIAVFKSLLSEVVLTLAVVTFIFMIIERISPAFEDISCAKHLKKWTVTLITFITTMLLTVLSIQNVISAKADSLSMRSVKFAASSFIPLVGGAVGESLKTVSNGISYLKTSLGASSSLALFFTVMPIFCELLFLKLFITFISFSASAFACNEQKLLLDSFVEIIDLFISIIICVVILSFLMIFVFVSVSFGA